MNDYPVGTEDDGYEWMTHPCAHCGAAFSDQPGPEGWPFAYCWTCQETQRCQHNTLYKDDFDILPALKGEDSREDFP